MKTTPSVPVDRVAAASAAAILLAVGGVSSVNGIFGIYDNTADELSDLLNIDDVPPVIVTAAKIAKPVYEPLKALSPSCTEALFPEFNELNDWNDCSLLSNRVFWRAGGGAKPPLFIKQTMRTDNMWEASTGSAVWGGGVVLSRFMETGLGDGYWEGKRVLELGTGTGLGSITASKLGAARVLATDRDPKVLELAVRNAKANGASIGTAMLDWGTNAPLLEDGWDVVIGADLTYNRDAWPVLFDTLKAAKAPCILSASERRPNELQSLEAALTSAGLKYEVLPSPMDKGYGREQVRMYRITYDGAAIVAPQPPQQQQKAPAAKPQKANSATAAEKLAEEKARYKELAGALLRASFNREGQAWYEVDAVLKQERLDWAYSKVKEKGFDASRPPEPPESLRRAASQSSPPSAAPSVDLMYSRGAS